MSAEDRQELENVQPPGTTNAVDSGTEQSLDRAHAQDGDAANRPGEGPPVVSDAPEADADIDGAAEPEPGTAPEGATPAVPRTPGDPLADANSRTGRAPAD